MYITIIGEVGYTGNSHPPRVLYQHGTARQLGWDLAHRTGKVIGLAKQSSLAQFYCLISDKPVFREVELFLYYYLCRICLYDSGAPLYASDGRQILIGEYFYAPLAWYLQLGVDY